MNIESLVRYFANPCGRNVIDAMRAGHLDLIDQPNQGKQPSCNEVREAGVPWIADNGAFSDKFDEGKWWKFLTDKAHAAATCVFAVAPDVVGDAAATLERSAPWFGPIRGLGYPVALVAQNGLRSEDVPWDEIDALFLGGSLECRPCAYVFREARRPRRDEACPTCQRRLREYKLNQEARDLTREAKRRGKWVHMGRVNSRKRWDYAEEIGCDSADGTYLTFGPDLNLARLRAWSGGERQASLLTTTST